MTTQQNSERLEHPLPKYRDLATRIYRDVVRRRTTVRVHQAKWAQDTSFELSFLLGLYRSGTTPLRYSLGMHPSLATPPETDFLAPFLESLRDPRGLRGLESMGFDPQHVESCYRQAALYFYENYAASVDPGVQMLLDKSPLYVSYADLIPQLFPSSRFIILIRHPFGQIGSLTRHGSMEPDVPGFPVDYESLSAASAMYWAEGTERLLDLAESTGSIVVRYEDLCEQPETVLRQLTDGLELPWDPAVMAYDGSTQDRGMEGAKALAYKTFESWMADPMRGWSDEAAAELSNEWRRVAQVAERCGYSEKAAGEWKWTIG